MKIAFLVLSLVGLPMAWTLGAGQDQPGAPVIGYVSPLRIMAESPEGKARAARMQTLQQQRTAELRTKQQALEKTRQQLAQTADASSRGQLQLQEQQQRLDFERATLQAQADIQNLQRQVNAELQVKVKATLDEILKGRNVRLVLNSETAVIWAEPGLDFTDQVLERLNSTTPAP